MQDRADLPSPTGPRPVRVLWAIKGLGPGGAERLLVHHAAAADADAFELTCAYLVPQKSQLVAELETHGVDVVLLPVRHPADPRWLLGLRRLLRHRAPDVLHAHAPLVAAGARLVTRTLPRSQRPALMTTEHNRWPRHRPLTRLANRATLRLDDAHVAVSADVRATMPSWVQPRVEVIEHGIPLETVRATAEHSAVRTELGLRDDDLVVCCLANLRREKGHADLLEAVAIAASRAPRLRVLLVGQGPLAEEVAERHARLGLDDVVLLLGYRSDATRVLSAADALVLASHHEGLPVALMEARAFGLPVLATSVGGLPEVVRDGVDGLLVPPAQPARLADALVRFATDEDLRAHLSEGASAERDRFEVRHAVARLEALYQRLADERRRPSSSL